MLCVNFFLLSCTWCWLQHGSRRKGVPEGGGVSLTPWLICRPLGLGYCRHEEHSLGKLLSVRTVRVRGCQTLRLTVWPGPLAGSKRAGFKFWVVLGTGTGLTPTFGATIEDIEKLISCEMQLTKVLSFGCDCGHCGLIPLRRASGVALPL